MVCISYLDISGDPAPPLPDAAPAPTLASRATNIGGSMAFGDPTLKDEMLGRPSGRTSS
jgi:hypothetical protein